MIAPRLDPYRRVVHASSPAGFTLVELLAASALVVVLVGLALQATVGVKRRAAREQASAELAALAVALEAYRRQFGDYPHAADARELVAALAGERGPRGDPIVGPAFADLAAFTIRPAAPPASVRELLDPWQQPYQFHYVAPEGSASHGGFKLYSVGPDGRARPPEAGGAIDADHPDNRDNVYAQ